MGKCKQTLEKKAELQDHAKSLWVTQARGDNEKKRILSRGDGDLSKVALRWDQAAWEREGTFKLETARKKVMAVTFIPRK